MAPFDLIWFIANCSNHQFFFFLIDFEPFKINCICFSFLKIYCIWINRWNSCRNQVKTGITVQNSFQLTRENTMAIVCTYCLSVICFQFLFANEMKLNCTSFGFWMLKSTKVYFSWAIWSRIGIGIYWFDALFLV